MVQGRHGLHLCLTTTLIRIPTGFPTRHPSRCSHLRRFVKTMTTTCSRVAITLLVADADEVALTHQEGDGEMTTAVGEDAGEAEGVVSVAEVVV